MDQYLATKCKIIYKVSLYAKGDAVEIKTNSNLYTLQTSRL